LFSADSPVLQELEFENLAIVIDKIRASCEQIASFLKESISPAPNHYLGVRLPLDANSTDGLAGVARSLHVALDQPVRHMGYAPLRVSSAEPGSIWLELVATSAPVMVLLGMLLRWGIELAKVRQAVLMVEAERQRLEQERQKAMQGQLTVQGERERLEQERQKTVQGGLALLQQHERLEQERQKTLRESLSLRIAAAEHKQRALENEELTLWAEAHSAFKRLASERRDAGEIAAVLHNATEEVAGLKRRGAHFRLQINAEPEVANAFPPEALELEAPVHADELAEDQDSRLISDR
jgi:hypothetical protein